MPSQYFKMSACILIAFSYCW